MSQGRFFVVDLGQWFKACALSMNAAVAYLVLARFSDAKNVNTSAGVHAIEERTNVSRGRAKKALDELERSGLIRSAKAKSTIVRKTLTQATIKARRPVFLPNALVDGANGETSPVELIRQGQNLPALRLFVELYASQNLAEDGGLRFGQSVWRKYEVLRYDARGGWAVLGFKPGGDFVNTRASFASSFFPDNGANFWTAWEVIRDSGLVEEVPYVVEADSQEAEAEVVYPASREAGLPEERRVAQAAEEFARALLGSARYDRILEEHPTMDFAPVRTSLSTATVVGIYRLRYRPRTRMTGRWFADLQESCREYEVRLRDESRGMLNRRSLSPTTEGGSSQVEQLRNR